MVGPLLTLLLCCLHLNMLDSVFDYNTIFRILSLRLMCALNSLVNHGLSLFLTTRERPFNFKGGGGYGFLFRSEFCFRTTQELEYLFFLSGKARICFPEFHIRLYDKNSESDYFFFLHQNQNICFSNIGNQNISLEKKPYPPFKLNGRSLTGSYTLQTKRVRMH
jgi:hypothetical protein